ARRRPAPRPGRRRRTPRPVSRGARSSTLNELAPGGETAADLFGRHAQRLLGDAVGDLPLRLVVVAGALEQRLAEGDELLGGAAEEAPKRLGRRAGPEDSRPGERRT